jgi:type IV fimbrial biogenesis protein FimT
MIPARGSARQRGVTLVEVAVVLTIAAMLYVGAVPLFSTWTGNAATRTAADGFLNGLQVARAEAIRRNRTVQLTFDATTGTGWSLGCAVPVDNGAAGVDDPGDCLAVIQSRSGAEGSAAPQMTPVPADATTISFNSLGRLVPNLDGSPTATQVDFVNPSLAVANRRTLRVTFGAGGDVRMCDPALASTDPRGC